MGDRIDAPLPASSYDLEIIIVGINHPGNLGAISRAMLNYGFDKLTLVNPNCSVDNDEARNRAKHSGYILDNSTICETLSEAVEKSSLVIGTSGKREVGSKILRRHFLLPWELSDKLRNYDGRVSLVFGEEGKGLTASQLGLCDFLVTLPTWEGYPIANLSHAVSQLCYELHRDRIINGLTVKGVKNQKAISSDLRLILRKSIDDFCQSLDSDKSDLINDVFERVLLRGLPIDSEAERMIGAFVQATTALQKQSGNEEWRRDRRKRVTPDNQSDR